MILSLFQIQKIILAVLKTIYYDKRHQIDRNLCFKGYVPLFSPNSPLCGAHLSEAGYKRVALLIRQILYYLKEYLPSSFPLTPENKKLLDYQNRFLNKGTRKRHYEDNDRKSSSKYYKPNHYKPYTY